MQRKILQPFKNRKQCEFSPLLIVSLPLTFASNFLSFNFFSYTNDDSDPNVSRGDHIISYHIHLPNPNSISPGTVSDQN